MELNEIYSRIVTHQIKGVMLHEQMANYYDFLGLEGYKRCHEYHMFKEMCTYRSTYRYFINHHNMLIPDERIENPEAIPASWFKYTRQDVDSATKKNAVKSGLNAWVDWERDTKALYEDMYGELMELGEVASALKIKQLVCDVDCELKKAERYQLNKEAIGYDMGAIIAEQKPKHHKYQKKMEEELKIELC